MTEIKKRVNSAIDFLEQDNRGVQLGCYSVALAGLGIALRKVRPFSQFRKPSDIPNHFIKERKELTGVVERIEPNGALLMIRHRPLVALPGLPDGQLPVKISGVKVSGFGLNWLQAIVAGNDVRFIPVAKNKDFVQCEVLLPQTQNNKVQILNLGESLVKIGFGEVVNVETPLSNDRTYLNYCNQLRAAELYALRRKLGMLYYYNISKDILATFVSVLNRLVLRTYRKIVYIPKLPTP